MRSTILSTSQNSQVTDVLLLLFRIAIGIVFLHTGKPKIIDPFHWMGPQGGFPAFWQLLAAIAEFIGGIAIILGFLTRIAAFGIFCTMAVSIYVMVANYGAPFVNMQGGPAYNLNILLLLVAFMLIILGPGRFSVDRLLFGVTLRRTEI